MWQTIIHIVFIFPPSGSRPWIAWDKTPAAAASAREH